MERSIMANDNSVKNREPAVDNGAGSFEKSNRESKAFNQSKTRLEPGSPEWSRYWSLVFRRMK
jgi:hypothetical protein